MTSGAGGSAAERAYVWTRARIIDGSLAGGTMVSEGDVSAALEISRTPVREAFLRLAGEGALQLFPKRGALVLPVTVADVGDVVGARLLIEPWAVRAAGAGPGRRRLVADLRAQLRALAEADAAGDPTGFQEADRAFHEAIVAAAGNRLLEGFYRSLRDRQLRMGAAAVLADRDRTATIAREHAAIADALDAAEPDAAARHLEAHIRRTGEVLATRPAG